MSVILTDLDQKLISGDFGEASKMAMRIVLRMAEVLGVSELIDIQSAHIDGCGLMTDSALEFAEKLAGLGGQVVVPTTTNMIPLDLQNWRKQGIPEEFAFKAIRLSNAYLKMGCIPTWTCTPYQVYPPPRLHQQIAWGESNAIVYANSILGARTERYADFFDICAALTGRVPRYGMHLHENRRGQVLFQLVGFDSKAFDDDTFYPALGFLIGKIARDRVVVIDGLAYHPSSDQLKALGAAAASTGAVALFHIVGITPEAPTLQAAMQDLPPEEIVKVTPADLSLAKKGLSTINANGRKLDAVILGCPHFSIAEFGKLARFLEGFQGKCHPDVQFYVMTNQVSYALAGRSGFLEVLQDFGVRLTIDTCVLNTPVTLPNTRLVMTNSGKDAYYAPSELGVEVVFASLEDCVRSAAAGVVMKEDEG